MYNQTKLKHLQNQKREDSSASTSSESSSTHSRAQYTATQTTGSIAPIPLTTNNDSDAMCLARAAQIIRTDMFQKLFSFNGSFSSKCQEKSLSLVLIAMVSMLPEGPNVLKQTAHPYMRANSSRSTGTS
ncbi:hypothetical protein GQR58_026594 [Nymphon striatum]|nr:hypothetical protein GQR58_026594 [Nymphon striatum]